MLGSLQESLPYLSKGAWAHSAIGGREVDRRELLAVTSHDVERLILI